MLKNEVNFAPDAVDKRLVNPLPMNRADSWFSISMDLVRFCLAVTVLVCHIPALQGGFPGWLAHSCVIVFFVISGYFISQSVFTKKMGFRAYAIARLSRLYSVLAPALVLTGILLTVGTMINPPFYAALSRGHEPLRLLLSLVFGQETWFLSASPTSNGPLWSLAFEFWYYALFAGFFFARGLRAKLTVSLLAAAVAGPKILLLLPTWLAGVACCASARRRVPTRQVSRISFAIFAALIICLESAKFEYPFPEGTFPLFHSGSFVSDWMLSLLVAATIYFLHGAVPSSQAPAGLADVARRAGNATFAIYLLHYPLQKFIIATLLPRLPELGHPWMDAICVLPPLLIAGACGLLFESSRPRIAAALDSLLPGTSDRTDSDKRKAA